MVFTQKYTIISPIEIIAEGQEFASNDWPLHTTIADTFAINSINEDFISLMRTVALGRNIKIAAKELSYFGKSADIEVMLLQSSDELYRLHSDIVDMLLSCGASFNDPQYTKSGFVGHVTQQPRKRMSTGEEISLHSIALIDMFPDENPNNRRVIKVINFREE